MCCATRCRPVHAHLSGGALDWKLGLSYHCPAVPLGGLTGLAATRGQDRVSREVERYSPHPRTSFVKLCCLPPKPCLGELVIFGRGDGPGIPIGAARPE
eukprot:354371-Chlamydomonas_euryale.AAC.2